MPFLSLTHCFTISSFIYNYAANHIKKHIWRSTVLQVKVVAPKWRHNINDRINGSSICNWVRLRMKKPGIWDGAILNLKYSTSKCNLIIFSVYVSHFKSLSDFYVRLFDEFGLWDNLEKEIKNGKLPEVPKPRRHGIFIIFDKLTGKMHRLRFDSNRVK